MGKILLLLVMTLSFFISGLMFFAGDTNENYLCYTNYAWIPFVISFILFFVLLLKRTRK
jgi:hypothetical protein